VLVGIGTVSIRLTDVKKLPPPRGRCCCRLLLLLPAFLIHVFMALRSVMEGKASMALDSPGQHLGLAMF